MQSLSPTIGNGGHNARDKDGQTGTGALGTVVRIVREFRRPRGVALVRFDDGMQAEVWENRFPSGKGNA
jgi:hypothetical protein